MKVRTVAVAVCITLLLSMLPAQGAVGMARDPGYAQVAAGAASDYRALEEPPEGYEEVVLHQDPMDDFSAWVPYDGSLGAWSIDTEAYFSAPSSALFAYPEGGWGDLGLAVPIDLSEAVGAWVNLSLDTDAPVNVLLYSAADFSVIDQVAVTEPGSYTVWLDMAALCGQAAVSMGLEVAAADESSSGSVHLDDIQVLAWVPEGTGPPPPDGDGDDPGLPTAANPIKRVSIAKGGGEADLGASFPAVSADGRYVAFESSSQNLVEGDVNAPCIFVRDVVEGVTELVTFGYNGGGADSYSLNPDISGDGRYVAYSSEARNLVSGDSNDREDVFVFDRQTGTTERVSVSSSGEEGSVDVITAESVPPLPQLSADGRYVAFVSDFSNLVPGDTNGNTDVFVHDRNTGSTERISTDGAVEALDGRCKAAVISPDGRYVSWTVVADEPVYSWWIHDRNTGATERFDSGEILSFSDSSRWWTVEYGPNAAVYDSQEGTYEFMTDFHEVSQLQSKGASISGDGRRVAYASHFTDRTPDVLDHDEVYVRDLGAGSTEPRIVSVAADGQRPNNDCEPCEISADGNYVVFESSATNLVPDDGWQGDVYIAYVGSGSPDDVPVVSIAGTSRYDTAVAASKHAFPEGADTVVIATGRRWPDALGGTALAGVLDGPILLTDTNDVPDAVMTEISRLGATKAVVLGGTDVVGPAAFSELASALQAANVERIAGGSRYETANKVAERVIAKLGEAYDGTAFIATGGKFPDALAAAPLAAAKGWPLLLAHPTSGLSAATKAEMAPVSRALILGGTDVVGPATESYLKTAIGDTNVTRLAGTSRYETAVKVAEYGVANAGLAWDKVGVTTGQRFPDALAGGVVQGKASSVMLLTKSESLEAVTEDAFSANKAAISTFTVFGGDDAVSQAVRDAVQQALR